MIGATARRRAILAGLLALPLAHAWAQFKEPTGPQPELPKEKLVIATRDGKTHDFQIEMATTSEQQQVGEMFRTSVPDNGGMLFVWPSVQLSGMWMKNTLVSLDMVFIDADGTIKTIAERTVPHSLATVSSNVPVRATLELAAGVTEKLNIRVGDKVRHKLFGTAP